MSNFKSTLDQGSIETCTGIGDAGAISNAEGDSEQQFNSWLQDIHTKFLTLPGARRVQLLDSLIGLCGSQELLHLTNILPTLLYRDFLRLLPPETSIRILLYLDERSVLNCCLVSKAWNQLINSLREIWIQLARCVGARITVEPGSQARVYKNLYLQSVHWMQSMRNGTAFEKITLTGHTSRVMAIAHNGDLVATGSDDRTVRFWDIKTATCIKVIETHTVSSLQFDDLYLYTTSYDATAACWDMDTGELVCRYIGHVSAILCLDARRDLDLLVTGAADATVKIWNLTTAALLNSLSTVSETGLVFKVRLLNCTDSSSQTGEQRTLQLLAINRCTYYFWIVTNNKLIHNNLLMNEDCCAHSSIVTENFVNVSCRGKHKTRPVLIFTTECVDDKCVYQPMSTVDLPKYLSVNLTNTCKKAVMSVGTKFALFVVADGLVEIMDIQSSMIVCSFPVPPIRVSQNGESVKQGNYDWLDGFAENNTSGIFLGLCLLDNDVLLLKWRDHRLRCLPSNS